ncbi:MAG: response regulator transcription factor [bacterium]|nr:response regulator transcription factor [bacterium]
MTLRLALAEDKPYLAQVFIEKLSLFPGSFELVIFSRNGLDLVDRLKTTHNVDVVLLDLEMPGMSCVGTIKKVLQHHPHLKIIMFTVFDDQELLSQCMDAGAAGYLLKDEPAKVVHEMLRCLAKNKVQE